MALLSFWKSDSAAVLSMSIKQIVSTAGDGKLRDSTECSEELRSFLSQVGSDKLADYAEYCLTQAFENSGIVLQDVVNELGRRLDYVVSNGPYQGTSNSIGYDGLWTSPDGHTLLVEVKTTDAYRLPLDRIAGYRQKLRDQGNLKEPNSMLIIVGREDTGELEAQVRGSRHAWDMRLISVESLVHLVKLKESTDEALTGSKIRSVLVPREYTRVDSLIDIIFTAAKDVESSIEDEKEPRTEDDSGSGWVFTDRDLLDSKRAAIITAFANSRNIKLIRKSRALYWTSEHDWRAVCTVSKHHSRAAGKAVYWYAYHPRWDNFLGEATNSFVLLGCMDLQIAFAIPLETIRARLNELNQKPEEDGQTFWYVHVIEQGSGEFVLQMPKTGDHLPLGQYIVKISND